MSTSTLLVDDTDPAVQYVAGWDWQHPYMVEVDGTRHAASKAGLTASLAFAGTGVQVIGTVEVSSNAGTPLTSYAIDGQVMGSYRAPQTGSTMYNVTFFMKTGLSLGDHEIVITNEDGTSPNTFYLDYFIINPISKPSDTVTTSPPAAIVQSTTTTTVNNQPASTKTTQTTEPVHSLTTTVTTPVSSSSSTSSQSSSQTSSSSQSSTSSLTSSEASSLTSSSVVSASSASASANVTLTVPPISSESTTAPLAALGDSSSTTTLLGSSGGSGAATPGVTGSPNGASSSSSANSRHTNIAAIVGGVLGAVALLALVAIIFLLRRKRKDRDNIHPFVSMHEETPAQSPTSTLGPALYAGTIPAKAREAMQMRMEAASSARPVSVQYGSHIPAVGSASREFLHPDDHDGDHDVSPASPASSSHSPGGVSPGGYYYGDQHTKLQETLYGSLSSGGAPSTSHLLSPVSPSDAGSSVSGTIMGAGASAGAHGRGRSDTVTTSPLVAEEVARAPWYAPPERQSRAESLLRALTSRSAGGEGGGEGRPAGRRRGTGRGRAGTQDEDSGLRMYNEATLPPPYTPD